MESLLLAAGAGTTQHFEVIVSLLIGVLGLLGSITRGIRKVKAAIDAHVASVRQLTEAIRHLGDRVSDIEDELGTFPNGKRAR